MFMRLSALLIAAGFTLVPLGGVGAQELPPVPALPDSDSDTGGHETQDPSGKDHASAVAWEITSRGENGDEEFITIAKTHAEMDEDGANRSEATGLSIMGTPVVATSSQARNGSASSSATNNAFCLIEGIFCPGIVYAETSNEDGANGSTAKSSAGLLSMCVIDGAGGIIVFVDGRTCVLEVEAIASRSEVSQNKQTGEGEASSLSVPLIICAYDEPLLNGLSATAHGEPVACAGAFSFSGSDTNGPTGDGGTFRLSFFFFDLEGEENDETFTESQTFHGDLDGFEAGDDGCPSAEITFGYCAHFNQGESFQFPGGAGSRQEAMHVVGYEDGQAFGDFHFGVAETLVRIPAVQVLPRVVTKKVVTSVGATLAFTGMDLDEILAFGASLALLGALALYAASRERSRRATS